MTARLHGANLRDIQRGTLGALTAELRDLDLRPLRSDARLSRAQKAAVKQADGNQNGVLFDEGERGPPKWARNVVVQYGQAAASVGLSRRDEEVLITDLLGALETKWGAPVTDLPLDAIPKRGVEMAIRKASMLVRMGLEPHRVEDFVLDVSGRLGASRARDQRIFGQHFRADPEAASGKVVVLTPGFQETGRSFEKQVGEMLGRGYDVVTFDAPWAGHSDGAEGTFDSIEALGRNVNAVCAYAESRRLALHGGRDDSELVLMGNSMGGLAALCAKAMSDAGEAKLDRVQVKADAGDVRAVPTRMPGGVKLLLQAPFLGLSDGLLNDALAFVGKLPAINRIGLPSNGVAPKITSDRHVALVNAQATLLEHLQARPEAMAKGIDGGKRVKAFVQAQGLEGDVAIYHQRGDTLANHDDSAALARTLRERPGGHVELVSAPGVDHVVQNDPDVYRDPIDLLDRLAAR